MVDTKVYRAIVRFINEHKYSPSYKELCELTGIASTGTVCRAVQSLKEKGLITTERYGNRTIRLTKAHPECDVVEVVHGEWIKKEDGHYVCSECGRTRPYNYSTYAIENWACNYCHHCGAKMDGKEEAK